MKKDRIRMFRDALSFVVVALTFTLGSCTEELLAPPIVGGEDLEVRVSFSGNATRGVDYNTKAESRIDRMTVFVFNVGGSKLEALLDVDVSSSNPSQPKWETEKILIIKSVPDVMKDKRLFAVANYWTETTSIDMNTFTLDDLGNILVPLDALPTYPIVMTGDTYAYGGVVYGSFEMSRVVAGLDIAITPAKHSQIEWIESKVTLHELAQSVSLFSNLRSTAIPLFGARLDVAMSKDGDLMVNKEKAFMGAIDHPVRVVVQMPYKNLITGVVEYDNYYETTIGAVLPNFIYKLKLQISGMGLPFDKLKPNVNIADQLTINDWEDGGMGDVEAPNYFFNVDCTRMELQSGMTLESKITTNVPDWKLVKEDGTTVVSFVEGKSTYSYGATIELKGDVDKAKIVVYGTLYGPLKLFFIAKNLKVPFTIVYDNGIIPNSALIEAGWPSEKLPKNGLQLAKRGYKVLPSGVADSDDVLLQWKTSDTSTPGTSSGMGMGKSNTAAMNGVEHPAAQYCRDMGEGWFLPSRDELWKVFRNGHNVGLFGPSYSFGKGDSYYWSSTERASDVRSADYVALYGVSGFLSKGTAYRVRCVKAI